MVGGEDRLPVALDEGRLLGDKPEPVLRLGLHQGHLLPPPQSTLHLPVIPSLARGSQLPSPGCWGRVGKKQEIVTTMKGTFLVALGVELGYLFDCFLVS